MKEKLIKVGKVLLTTCMLWGTSVGVGFTSAFFFGEYSYPVNPDKQYPSPNKKETILCGFSFIGNHK